MPKEVAAQSPVGCGREEPNRNPHLPEPTGRIAFSWYAATPRPQRCHFLTITRIIRFFLCFFFLSVSMLLIRLHCPSDTIAPASPCFVYGWYTKESGDEHHDDLWTQHRSSDLQRHLLSRLRPGPAVSAAIGQCGHRCNFRHHHKRGGSLCAVRALDASGRR